MRTRQVCGPDGRFVISKQLARLRRQRFVVPKRLAGIRKRLASVVKGRFVVPKPLAGIGKPLVGLGKLGGGWD
jgi:hypothetical protein